MFHVKQSRVNTYCVGVAKPLSLTTPTQPKADNMKETLLNLVLSTVFMAAGVIGWPAYFDCLTY